VREGDEECDPPGGDCPPDQFCTDECVCLFGGGS